MRAAALILCAVFAVLSAFGADEPPHARAKRILGLGQKTVSVSLCQSGPAVQNRNERWSKEVRSSLEGFSAALAERSVKVTLATRAWKECPVQVSSGCYSTAGHIYCSDLALERVVFSLELLLYQARQQAGGAFRENDRIAEAEAVLERLWRFPYPGNPAFEAVDANLFPDWWESNSGNRTYAAWRDQWMNSARQLHNQPREAWLAHARDLVIWFIVGHEVFHALRTCPVSAPGFAERTGYLDAATALQQQEAFCPNPPDNVEVNADSCGLRFLEAADKKAGAQDEDLLLGKVARAGAMLTLSEIFAVGLQAPTKKRKRGWVMDGYLYPFLRTAIVHRTLFDLNGRDAELLCGNSLEYLRENMYQSTFCSSEGPGGSDYMFTPTPRRTDVTESDLFPAVNGPSRTGWGGPRSCLSGDVNIAAIHPVRGDPAVTARILAVEPEIKDQVIPDPGFVQQMLSRPHIHVRLSTCLSNEKRPSRFRLRYTHKGQLDEVNGGTRQEERDCVRSALGELNFGDTIDDRPIDPTKPYKAPGYTMVLELQKSD